jgi:mycothiol S-conjugate amidase
VSHNLSMIAVHAHPDDESSKGGATLAKYAAEGVRVAVATFTGGERGDLLNPALAHRTDLVESIHEVRRAEMAAAARALGVEQRFLGFVDSGLPEDPAAPLPEGSFATIKASVAAVPLVEMIREIRPQVLTTYDVSGGYPHPDHIHTHTVSMEALRLAACDDFRPDLGASFSVPKVYYDQGFSPDRVEAVHAAMLARGLDSPFAEWIERARDMPPRERHVTARIMVGDFFGQRDAALRAHATQVDPEGWFFAVPRDVEREVWPYEEFELVSSLVRVPTPETDLFAGLR